MTRLLLTIALAGVATLPVGGQRPATTITGRVVSDQTSAPLANVQVAVVSEALGAPVVLSDEEGRFSITPGPGTGGLRVRAMKTGYAPTEIVPAPATRFLEIRRVAGSHAARVAHPTGVHCDGSR